MSKMGVAKMRMLTWMCDKTRMVMIRNKRILEMIGVVPIEEKWGENRLSWFRHIYRRLVDAVVKRVDRIVLVTLRGGEDPN